MGTGVNCYYNKKNLVDGRVVRQTDVLHRKCIQVKFPVKRKGYLIHGLNDNLVMKLLVKRGVKFIDLPNIDWFNTDEIFKSFPIAILRV
jgi:hypothetical protein